MSTGSVFVSKRKKKNTSSNLKHPIKPFLRVAGMYKDSYIGIARAINASDSKSFHLILDELKNNKTYSNAAFSCPFPKLEELTNGRDVVGRLPKIKQFIWTACICARYSNEISEFVYLKQKYEEAYLLGSYTDAKNLLDDIEEKFNFSLWLINSRFELLQHESLQKQKDFLEEIVSVENISPIVAFFSNYFSLRNEDNTSYDVYLNEIESIFDVGNLASYAVYQLLPSGRENIDDTSIILAVEEENSIIDRYEALLAMVHIEFSRVTSQSDYNMLNNVLRSLEPIEDYRLDKFNYIFRGGDYNFDLEKITLYDNYTKGNYDINFSLEVNNIEIIARQYLFLGEKVLVDIPQDSIFLNIVKEVANILSKSGDLISSRKKLEKISLIISKHPVTNFISSFLARSDEYTLLKSRTSNEHYFALSLDLENPWIISTITSISPLKNYGDFLEEKYPESISYELNSLMDNHYNKSFLNIENLDMPIYRKSLYLGFLAYKYGLYPLAIEHFTGINSTDSKLVDAQSREYKVKALIANDQLLESIEIIVQHCLINISAAFHYPIVELLEVIEKNDDLKVSASQKAPYCILLSIASRYFHPRWERSLSDAFENILDNNDLERPAELYGLINNLGSEQTIYIMRFVAIPRIIDDLTIFEDVDEIESERIQICQKLLELDISNSQVHSNEIRIITKEAKVTHLVNHLDTSKIYINESGVLSHIDDSLTRSFKKYKALLELPELNIQVDKISEKLKELMINAELGTFTLPSSERISLFDSIYEFFIVELATNPAFGLDTYISTNIRHGAFEGQIRRSFDRHELLVNKHKGKIRERIPEQWAIYFADYDEDHVKLVLARMDRFTDRTVNIIDEYLQDFLQIQSDDSPKGGFDLNSEKDERKDLRDLINDKTSYDDFVQILLNKFWSLIDSSMLNIQNQLREDLKPRVISALDIMYNGILADLNIIDSGTFHDAIVNAKTEFESNINGLCEWFTRAKTKTIDEFELELATKVALKQVSNCYVSTLIKCNNQIDSSKKLDGRYFANMVEILFILFQNVVRHGGKENPTIDVNIIHSGKNIQIQVINTIGSDINVESLQKTIKELNQLYNSDYAMEHVSTEGGSGLSKIWRILEHEFKASHSLQLSLVENKQFMVLLKLQSGSIEYDN
jgi:hypothetical protein